MLSFSFAAFYERKNEISLDNKIKIDFYSIIPLALVVQWIEQHTPNVLMEVRFLPGAHSNTMQKVIIIPGLGDHIKMTQRMVSGWEKHGLSPIVYKMNWSDQENFKAKLNKLAALVEEKHKDSCDISVVGCSAGGSAALNLFLSHDRLINKAISICGRLKKGDCKGFRSFETRTKTSKAFEQSVELLEQKIGNFSPNQLERIMTVGPLLGDELVPADTMTIEGVKNITIPTIGHVFSICMALSAFSNSIINFINKE